MEQSRLLAKFCTKMATIVSLLTVLGFPSLFFLYVYQTEISSLESELEVTSSLLNREIRRNPTLWQYDQDALTNLLQLREGDEHDDSAFLFLADGRLLVEHSLNIQGLTLSKSEELTDAGKVVARLQIDRPLNPLLMQTSAVAVAALLLSFILFFLLKTLPLRAVSRAEHSLQRTNEFLAKVMESTTNAILVVDLDGNIQTGNPQSLELCGRTQEELQDIPLSNLFSEIDYARLKPSVDTIQKQGQPFSHVESRLLRHDGSTINITCTAVPLAQDGHIISTVWTLDDVTAQKVAEKKVQKLAYFDPLTSLPNRTLLGDRLEQILNHAERDNNQAAILFLDLDRFKDINDSLGHNIGDQLLIEVSKRLQEGLRETDTVARYGGDEFIIILSHVPADHEEYISLVARKILEQMELPLRIQGKELYTSCSIGISVFPLDGRDSQSLLKHADLAMYQVKNQGRNNFQFFSKDLNRKARERIQLESNLRNALEQKQLFLNFQPKLDLINGKISGLEVLTRWKHPEMGLISPSSFIPVAEETGIIHTIGPWIIRTACQQHMDWQAAGLNPPPIAINLSIRQLQQQDFIKQFSAILDETQISAEHLELEITESCLMESSEDLLHKLKILKNLGVNIAIDDFGTGYSSLGYLKYFPVDRLKIDRCFINDISNSVSDSKIAQAIIAMGKSLGMEVTAEGVELEEQLNILIKHGCDEIQGYLYSYPLSAIDTEDFLNKEEESLRSIIS